MDAPAEENSERRDGSLPSSARFCARSYWSTHIYWLTCSFLWHSHFLLGLALWVAQRAQVHATCKSSSALSRAWFCDVFLSLSLSRRAKLTIRVRQCALLQMNRDNCVMSRRWLTSQQKNTHWHVIYLLNSPYQIHIHLYIIVTPHSLFRWGGERKKAHAFVSIEIYIEKRK